MFLPCGVSDFLKHQVTGNQPLQGSVAKDPSVTDEELVTRKHALFLWGSGLRGSAVNFSGLLLVDC